MQRGLLTLKKERIKSNKLKFIDYPIFDGFVLILNTFSKLYINPYGWNFILKHTVDQNLFVESRKIPFAN